jgi:hypothetical protein
MLCRVPVPGGSFAASAGRLRLRQAEPRGVRALPSVTSRDSNLSLSNVPLLLRVAGNRATSAVVSRVPDRIRQHVVHRAVDVTGGAFKDERYEPTTGSSVGAKMSLGFQPSLYKLKNSFPGADSNPMEIHLVQIVREIHGPRQQPPAQVGALVQQGNVGYGARTVPAGQHAGWGIDVDWQAARDEGYMKIAAARKQFLVAEIARLTQIAQRTAAEDRQLRDLTWQLQVDTAKLTTHRTKGTVLTSLDPRYAQQRVSESVPLFTTREENSAGNAAVYTLQGRKFLENATLRDAPAVPIGDPILGMEFEAAALLEHGPQNQRLATYLGSVKWGWVRSAGKSDIKLTPLAKVTDNGVSAAFTAAVTHWNQLTVSDPLGLQAGQLPVMQIPTA